MCGGGGGGGDGGAAQREAERQARITEGYNKIQGVFSGFDDDFYNARGKSYVDYAKPQVDDQYSEAVKALTYALARNNRLDSSTAGDQKAKLQKQYDKAMTDTTSKGMDVTNSTRDAVDSARTNLVQINSNLADPNVISAQAQSAAEGLSAAKSFDPLAPLFTNVGEALATQADLERRQNSRYNTGLFTPPAASSGSVRYT